MNSDNFKFSCEICFHNYSTENKPLILPECGHTFCFTCLAKLLFNKRITCPLCKEITIVPKAELKKLPINRALLGEFKFPEEKQGEKKDNENLEKEFKEIILKMEKKLSEIFQNYEFLKNGSLLDAIDQVNSEFDKYINEINFYRQFNILKIQRAYEEFNFIFELEETFKNSRTKYLNSINKKDFDISHETKVLKSGFYFLEEYEKKLVDKDPRKYLYINKQDKEFIQKEFRKRLIKICDFNGFVKKYNINNITEPNSLNSELTSSCLSNDDEKIKFIFDHMVLDPNGNYYGSEDGKLEKILKMMTDKEKLKKVSEYLKLEYGYSPLHNDK